MDDSTQPPALYWIHSEKPTEWLRQRLAIVAIKANRLVRLTRQSQRPCRNHSGSFSQVAGTSWALTNPRISCYNPNLEKRLNLRFQLFALLIRYRAVKIDGVGRMSGEGELFYEC